MKKLTVICGSPRSINESNTYAALNAGIDYFKKNNKNLEVAFYKLPVNLQGCINCKKCNLWCNIQDGFQKILKDIETSDSILLGSPVYLDMPTPQVVAFLTRLNCMAENTNREFFKGKDIYLLATGFCSGTKTCIHTIIGACEMLGFNIPSRSTREYIVKWNDTKLRGGMRREDSIFINKKEEE